MGITTSLAKNGRRYAADKVYTPMPIELRKPVGCPVASFKAMPPLKGKHFIMPTGETMTWIVDCQFVPYNDCTVATSVAAYLPRPGRMPTVANRFVNGLLCIWRLRRRMKCEIIKGSSTNAAVPRVHPHPNGEYICYIGPGNIILMDIQTLEKAVKNKDSQFASYKYLAVSPNGSYVAYISRSGVNYSLTVMIRDGIYFMPVYENRLDHLCLSFVGTRQYTEHVECKWSPDSVHVAVGSTMGHLLVVRREGLDSICNVIPGMFELYSTSEQGPTVLATPMGFDFDPRYKYSILVFVDKNNTLYMLNIEEKEVIHQVVIDTVGSVNCIQYDNDGRVLAVATSEAVLELRCPDTLDIIYTIDMSATVPGGGVDPSPDMPIGGAESPMEQLNGNFPAVTRLSFSQFGDFIAVSSSDGYARIWQLKSDISLQNICRKTILGTVKANNIWRLPLPPRILMYLLQWSREVRMAKMDELEGQTEKVLREIKDMVL
ncbi:uncharacterized protein LOC135486325 [Lineus longissimus]|uniref:uncharacterized protein LOC135486325 n=1 Tax=Lineus longissimus TaxID=88925 RepID=UPI002B4E3FB0